MIIVYFLSVDVCKYILNYSLIHYLFTDLPNTDCLLGIVLGIVDTMWKREIDFSLLL